MYPTTCNTETKLGQNVQHESCTIHKTTIDDVTADTDNDAFCLCPVQTIFCKVSTLTENVQEKK